MGKFKITGQDGKSYVVTGDTAQGALTALKKHLGAVTQDNSQPAPQMTHDQLVAAYRAEKDPAKAQALAAQIEQPMPGETPEQAAVRAGGRLSPGPSKTESFLRGSTDSLTWGYGDEMAAGIGALAGSDTYAQGLEKQREAMRQARAENPKTFIAGQVTGAVAPALLTMGGSSAPTIGGRIAQGAAVGAGQGAVYGFGSGEGGAGNRAKSAIIQALGGAALGGAAPVLGKAIGAGWGKLVSAFNNRGVPAQAQNALLKVLQDSGLTVEQAMKRLDELGPDGMMADLNQGTQIAAAGAARTSPEAGQVMGSRLAARRESAAARLAPELDQSLGQFVDPYSQKMANKAERSVISPEYKTAIENAPALPKSVADMVAQGLTYPSKGMSLANRSTMSEIMTQVDDALAAENPSEVVTRLHDIRKTLDAQIVHGGKTDLLSNADKAAQGALSNARSVVDDILKNRVPGFAEADAKYAPLAKQQEAFDLGRSKVFSGGDNAITPAQMDAMAKGMTPAELAAAKSGARVKMERTIYNQNRNPANEVDRLLNRDWNKEKLQTIAGPRQADKLAKTLDRESTFTDTSNLVEANRGSRTAVLDAAKEYWGKGQKKGILDGAMQNTATGAAYGGFAGAKAGLVGTVAKNTIGKIVNAFRRDPADVAKAAGDMMTQTGMNAGKLVNELLVRRDQIGKVTAESAAIDKIIRALITSGARTGIVPTEGNRFSSPNGAAAVPQ